MADQVDHPWRCREHVPRERRARQADEVGVRRRVEVPVAVELVVPGGQRRVVDVEHDRPVRDLRPRGEPVVAFLGDRTSLVRVVAVEVQRRGPCGGRAGSRNGGRRAVVVLGPGASDVDVRAAAPRTSRRDVRSAGCRPATATAAAVANPAIASPIASRSERRGVARRFMGTSFVESPFPEARTLRNTPGFPVHRRPRRPTHRSIIRWLASEYLAP